MPINVATLLIEDEDDQAARALRILEPLGFDVQTVSNAEEARRLLAAKGGTFDLIVVDRRLPGSDREEPLDAVGDELLEDVCVLSPDSLVVVLTGRADVPQVQKAMADRGELSLEPGPPLDRVRHFEKTNYRGFEEYLSSVVDRLSQLHDFSIEYVVDGGVGTLPPEERRLLAKVGAAVQSSAITVRLLDGGLTGDSVYRAEAIDANGATVGRFIVKTRLRNILAPGPTGNYQMLHDSALVAMPFKRVFGLSSGREAQLIQDVGVSESLFSLLRHDEEMALSVLGVATDSIDSRMQRIRRVVTITELIAPLLEWDEFESAAHRLGIAALSGLMRVTSTSGPQHGDLHGANVLVASQRPVLIDFDRECVATETLDPVTLFLSSLFHPASPVSGTEWMRSSPTELLSDSFLVGCPYPGWFAALQDWARTSAIGQDEVWAIALAYCLRQIRFPESAERPEVVAWAEALARSAANHLAR